MAVADKARMHALSRSVQANTGSNKEFQRNLKRTSHALSMMVNSFKLSGDIDLITPEQAEFTQNDKVCRNPEKYQTDEETR